MDEKKKEKIINLLRLARKAKAVAFGRIAVKKSIASHNTKLIFSGKRNSNFLRRNCEICKQKGIQISYIFPDEELSKIFGRQKLTLVAIINKDFTRGIKIILDS